MSACRSGSGHTHDGRPYVILQTKKTNEEAKTPWRYKISVKVNHMLKPAKTKLGWDAPANEDARTFDAFVSGEGGLGWDFKGATWEERKREHAQKQAKETKKDT